MNGAQRQGQEAHQFRGDPSAPQQAPGVVALPGRCNQTNLNVVGNAISRYDFKSRAEAIAGESSSSRGSFRCRSLSSAALSLYFGLHAISQARDSVSWPVAEGQVQSSSVEFRRGSRDRGSYHAQVLYSFTVGGKTHSENRVAFGDYGSGDPSRASTLSIAIPKARRSRSTTFEDDPDVCVLEPGVKGQHGSCPPSGWSSSWWESSWRWLFQRRCFSQDRFRSRSPASRYNRAYECHCGFGAPPMEHLSAALTAVLLFLFCGTPRGARQADGSTSRPAVTGPYKGGRTKGSGVFDLPRRRSKDSRPLYTSRRSGTST